jgi:hypothetical protein
MTACRARHAVQRSDSLRHVVCSSREPRLAGGFWSQTQLVGNATPHSQQTATCDSLMNSTVHITRADDYRSNAGSEISEEEWLRVVEMDPELVPVPQHGRHAVKWAAHPDRHDQLLEWSAGNIVIRAVDEDLIQKLETVAARLAARVQLVDGDMLTAPAHDTTGVPVLPTSTPGVSLCLAIAALAMLAVMLPLDGNVREEYPAGTEMPVAMELLLGLTAVLAALSWSGATITGGYAICMRVPRLRWAVAALIINCWSTYLFVITR